MLQSRSSLEQGRRRLLTTLGVTALALALTACGTGEVPAAHQSATNGTWSLDHAEPDGVLLGVWGTSPHDVWAAGGQADRGLVLHFDGTKWTPVDTGATALLWWIYGFGPDDVYAVGEHGTIVHYDGKVWERVESGTDRTLFGSWGSSRDDVWIVGGDPSGEPGSGVILRGSGRTFHAIDGLPPGLMPKSLFKVYGRPTGDVVTVGSDGTVLRWDGAWKRDDVPTTAPIISLWGRGANEFYAVGGVNAGEVLHFDGAKWTEVAGIGPSPQLFGVFTAPTLPIFAVGAQAQILEIVPGRDAVAQQAPGMQPSWVLHSVWGDGEGTVYSVGGSLMTYPASMSGVVLRRR